MSSSKFLYCTEYFLKQHLKNIKNFKRINLIIIQHLLCDTEQFINLLMEIGFKIEKVIGIEYSSSDNILFNLKKKNLDVVIPKFSELENTVEHTICSSIEETKKHSNLKFLIHEVGGYCAPFLKKNFVDIKKNFIGIVEDTKQGFWRYKNLDALPIPLFEVANSRLKMIEIHHVGEAVARSIESDLLDLGGSLAGCNVGILGFGDVGASVSKSLDSRNAVVSCYDPDPIKVIMAQNHGFLYLEKKKILKNSELIIGSSGRQSLFIKDLSILKDNVILASSSSKKLEIPTDEIIRLAANAESISKFIIRYTMPWGKKIYLINHGFPINFRRFSLPNNISDLMFCQISYGIVKLLNDNLLPKIHKLSEDEEKEIAKLWLRFNSRLNCFLEEEPRRA